MINVPLDQSHHFFFSCNDHLESFHRPPQSLRHRQEPAACSVGSAGRREVWETRSGYVHPVRGVYIDAKSTPLLYFHDLQPVHLSRFSSGYPFAVSRCQLSAIRIRGVIHYFSRCAHCSRGSSFRWLYSQAPPASSLAVFWSTGKCWSLLFESQRRDSTVDPYYQLRPQAERCALRSSA